MGGHRGRGAQGAQGWAWPVAGGRWPVAGSCDHAPVEFLNFLLIFAAGYLVLRRPEREGLAFALLVASTALMAFLFLVGTRTSVLPPFNY